MITRAKISAVRANSFAVYSVFPGYSRAALINFFCPRCGAKSRAALIRVNTVYVLHPRRKQVSCYTLTAP